MKKFIFYASSAFLFLLSSYNSIASQRANDKAKHAIINVVVRPIGKPFIVTIYEGKTNVIKSDESFDATVEKSELALFGALNTELDRMADLGYQIVAVATTSNILMTYTLEKR